MSTELHVLLSTHRVPDARRWQAGIDAAGFDLMLDPSLVVEKDTGFLPVRIHGRDSGFEFDLSLASDIAQTYPEFKSEFGERDRAANFRWGGDTAEMVCALVASAVLAQLTDGTIFDPQEGTFSDGEAALERARAELASTNLG